MDPIQFGLSLNCLCSYETSPSLKPQLDWIGLDWIGFIWVKFLLDCSRIPTELDWDWIGSHSNLNSAGLRLDLPKSNPNWTGSRLDWIQVESKLSWIKFGLSLRFGLMGLKRPLDLGIQIWLNFLEMDVSGGRRDLCQICKWIMQMNYANFGNYGTCQL